MTLDKTGGVLAGGTLTVNGVTMTVPANTLVTLPSVTVAWSELFLSSGSPNLPQFGTVSWDVTVGLPHSLYIIRATDHALGIRKSTGWTIPRGLDLHHPRCGSIPPRIHHLYRYDDWYFYGWREHCYTRQRRFQVCA